jgi:hypothetical protein
MDCSKISFASKEEGDIGTQLLLSSPLKDDKPPPSFLQRFNNEGARYRFNLGGGSESTQSQLGLSSPHLLAHH